MSRIVRLSGLEILDSRGRPTVKATCELEGGATGIASVPSGASTGGAEAAELRDGDPGRYGGLGCRQAARNIGGEIQSQLAGNEYPTQDALDRQLLTLDGTADKSRLGANALLAVSLAFARAQASERGIPLYEHFAHILAGQPSPSKQKPVSNSGTLPRPTINLFSGGKHAGGQVPIQDVLVVPASAGTIDEALAMTSAVFRSAAELCGRKYGMRLLRADEGGLAPPFPSVEAMVENAVESIAKAGLAPGRDVALAVDVAASHFYRQGTYSLGERSLSPPDMVEQLATWIRDYPIVSLEDGLAEEDWDHWPQLCERLEEKCLVVGDDLLCTNPERIRRAIDSRAATALLLKVNQIGTLSEAAQACTLARASGWCVTVSARSGETEDDWLADLSVGWRGDQIKVGSITQSERLAKYNRLLEIERDTGWPIVAWPNPAHRQP